MELLNLGLVTRLKHAPLVHHGCEDTDPLADSPQAPKGISTPDASRLPHGMREMRAVLNAALKEVELLRTENASLRRALGAAEEMLAEARTPPGAPRCRRRILGALPLDAGSHPGSGGRNGGRRAPCVPLLSPPAAATVSTPHATPLTPAAASSPGAYVAAAAVVAADGAVLVDVTARPLASASKAAPRTPLLLVTASALPVTPSTYCGDVASDGADTAESLPDSGSFTAVAARALPFAALSACYGTAPVAPCDGVRARSLSSIFAQCEVATPSTTAALTQQQQQQQAPGAPQQQPRPQWAFNGRSNSYNWRRTTSTV